ncbi:hypothetical protein SIID45300_02001 [Candidatus Magnetaquicoccaceae bacterium FCR-1]|uniref:DUF3782 domain-containing protein n=1 Tax=Candidatus Magnetaquiglobus chichijimensis TaxID=3141448 RepID=A0ABQ0C9W3_9PROT
MTETVTLEDVWKAFKETDLRMRETDLRIQETDRQMQETDRRLRESDRQFQESKQFILNLFAESDRRKQALDRQMREESAERDRVLREVSQQLGRLGGRLGEFIEEMIKPVCLNLFQARGIPVDELFARVKKIKAGRTMEIDLMLANTVAVVLIEVKSRLTAEDVQEHLDRLACFKAFFPRYADCRVYGAVAGMVIASEADRFAMNQGLFVITQNGENVHLANADDFVPRDW